jgi:hypothetical protein
MYASRGGPGKFICSFLMVPAEFPDALITQNVNIISMQAVGFEI